MTYMHVMKTSRRRSISMRPPSDQDIRRLHPWLTDPPEALGSKQDLPHRSRHPPQLQLPLAGHLANLTSKRHKRQQATQREPPVFPLFETLVSLVSLKREKEYKIEREDGGWSAKRPLQKFCGNLPRKCVTSDTAVSLLVFQPLNLQKKCRLCFRDATHPSSPPLLGSSSSGSSSHSVSVWSRQTVPGKRFSQSARHSERGGNAHPRRRCGRQGVHFRLLRYRPKAASLLCLSLGED